MQAKAIYVYGFKNEFMSWWNQVLIFCAQKNQHSKDTFCSYGSFSLI